MSGNMLSTRQLRVRTTVNELGMLAAYAVVRCTFTKMWENRFDLQSIFSDISGMPRYVV